MEIFVAELEKSEKTSDYSKNFLQHCFFLATKKDMFPTVARSPSGKPFFPDCPDFHFNVSHSGSFLTCCFHTAPVGIDLQCHQLPKIKVIDRVCSQSEQQWLTANPQGFSLLWVAKEAFVKESGEGVGSGRKLATLALPLPQFAEVFSAQQVPFNQKNFYFWRTNQYSLGVFGVELSQVVLKKIVFPH